MNTALYELVKVFRALSDPTRVRIMKLLLREKSLCVCEIMQALNISQTRASRNLGILKEAGFLKDERQGLWVHYRVDDGLPNSYAGEVAGLLREWLREDEVIQRDYRRSKRALKLEEVFKKRV